VIAIELILVLITACFGAAVFLERKLIRAVIYLAFAAISSALVLLYLGQAFIAMLQLLVFVGGLSTYLIVAVAIEEKGKKTLSNLSFVAFAVISALVLLQLTAFSANQSASPADFVSSAQQAFGSYYALFYICVVLLFASAMGSVLVLKRFARGSG